MPAFPQQEGQQPQPSPIVAPQQAPPDWESTLPDVAQKYGIQPDFLQRVIRQESGGNPRAVSPKGAQGLLQLMPDTAKRLGVQDPFDPAQNLDGGARELRRLLDKYQHYGKALAAYNAGEGVVDRLEGPGGFDSLPEETRNYVNSIMAGYQPPQRQAPTAQPAPQQPQAQGQGSFLNYLKGMSPALNPQGWYEGLKHVAQGFTAPGTLFGPTPTSPQEQQQAQGPRPTMQQILAEAQRTGEDPETVAEKYYQAPTAALNRPIFDPSQQMQPGFARGVAQGAAGLTSPGSIAQLALLPESKLINLLFTGQMGQDTYQSIMEGRKLEAQGNHQGAMEAYGRAAVAGGMTGLTGAHLVRGRRTEVQPTPREVPAETPSTIQRPAPAVQVAPPAAPSIAQEGGPQPVTATGITGAKEVKGYHTGRAPISAPIEGPQPTVGTVTPKPPIERGPERRVGQQIALPAEIERRQGERRQLAQVWGPQAGQPTPGEQLERQMRETRAGTPSGITEGQALAAIMKNPALDQKYRTADQKTRDQMLVDAKNRILSAKPTQAPTSTPTAPQPVPSARPAETPTYKTGQPVRSEPEPVRESPPSPQAVAPPPTIQPLKIYTDPKMGVKWAEDPITGHKVSVPKRIGDDPAAVEAYARPELEKQVKGFAEVQAELKQPPPPSPSALQPPTFTQRKAGEYLPREVEAAQQRAQERNVALAAGQGPAEWKREPVPEDRRAAAATLDRTFNRHLKTEGGRQTELDAAIERERAKGPEAVQAASQTYRDRVERNARQVTILQHLLSAPTREWDAEMRELLQAKPELLGEAEQITDPNTGQVRTRIKNPTFIWKTKEGVKGGSRALATKRPIEAALAEVYNDLRGNVMRVEAKASTRGLLEGESKANLDRLENEYGTLLKTVKSQEGSRPTDEQLKRLVDLRDSIFALTKEHRTAVGRPGFERGPLGELVPQGTGMPTRKFWNSLFGRPEGAHFAKPTPEMVKVRIGELQREGEAAREVATKLGAAPAEAAKPPLERAPEPVETRTPAVPAKTPTPPPAPIPEAPSAKYEKLASDIRAALRREDLPPEDRAGLQKALQQVEARLKPVTEAPKLAPVETPKPSPEISKPAPKTVGYRTGEVPKSVLTIKEPAPPTLSDRGGVGKPSSPPEPKKVYSTEKAPRLEPTPSAEKPFVQKAVTDAFNTQGRAGLAEFTNDELLRSKEYVGAQTRAAIEQELTEREAQKAEISKGFAQPTPTGKPLQAKEPPPAEIKFSDQETGSKADFARRQLGEISDRIGKMPEGEDRTDLRLRHNDVVNKFEDLTNKIKWASRAIAKMREAGTTKTLLKLGDRPTEFSLSELENIIRNRGLERSKLLQEQLPSIRDAISAFEKAPMKGAEPTAPTKTEPTVVPVYGEREAAVSPTTGKPVGFYPPAKIGEKVAVPSAAPTSEGTAAKVEQLKQMERHLANLMTKAGATPRRGDAIAISKLQKGVKQLRSALGKDAPPVPEALEASRLLKASAEPRPKPPTEIIEPTQKGYVSGKPQGENADSLMEYLREAATDRLQKLHEVGYKNEGVAAGQDTIAKPIMDAVRAGKVDATDAARRYEAALGAYYTGLKNKDYTGLGRAVQIAKGEMPLQKGLEGRPFVVPKKDKGQAGFFSFGGKPTATPQAARRVAKNTLGKLAETVEKLPASKDVDSRIERALAAGQKAVKTTPGTFANAYQRAATLSHTMLDLYRRPPKWTDFEDGLGMFRTVKLRSDLENRNFVRAIQDHLGVPSLLRQTIHPVKASAEMKAANLRLEALTNYLEAGGDEKLLKARATASSKEHRPGYELASNLNPEEKMMAEAIRAHFEERSKQGLAMGLMKGYVENYAPHIWKDKGFLQSLYAEANAGLLQKNFRFGMKRAFGSFFEGEQRGLTPKVKRIDALVAIYNNAFETALNTRMLSHRLFDGVAEDGRPILAINKGGAIRLEGGQRLDPATQKVIDENPAYLLKPHSRPFAEDLDMSGYKQIPHPAFQRWMWKARIDGKDVMMASDAWVHPDYARKLENLTGKSLVREYTLGRALLKGTAVLKQTELGAIGAFHYVQEGLHDVWHLRNPLNADAWSGKRLREAVDDPVVLGGVHHGLNLFDGNAAAEFADGMSVMDRIPGLGKYVRAGTDHLFHTYIPSLKADLYKHIVAKNLERYKGDVAAGKITEDQLKVISARTVNNAFGDLPTLTRNKTFQDVLRLSFLAPDFLEARARFLGQASRPYGWNAFVPVMRNIAMLYAGARIMNQVINKDPLWDPQYWDSVKVGDKVYGLRSVVGDFFHAVSHPDNFFYWRLSPLARPIVGSMASVRKGVPYRMRDLIPEVSPIMAQGAVKKFLDKNVRDPGVAKSIWETIGVRESKFYTPEQRKSIEQRQEQEEKRQRGERGVFHLQPPRLPRLVSPRVR